MDVDFTLERARQCQYAVKHLFAWVRATYDYNNVFQEFRPLRQRHEVT